MEEISISKFKAQCLRLLDEVNRRREPLLVKRNGQPIAIVHPVPKAQTRVSFGVAKGSGKIAGDIIPPASDLDEWEILK